MSEPVLVEETLADDGIYTTEWYCDPPPRGVPFTTTKAEWDNDYKIRRVFDFVLATETRPRRI